MISIKLDRQELDEITISLLKAASLRKAQQESISPEYAALLRRLTDKLVKAHNRLLSQEK